MFSYDHSDILGSNIMYV